MMNWVNCEGKPIRYSCSDKMDVLPCNENEGKKNRSVCMSVCKQLFQRWGMPGVYRVRQDEEEWDEKTGCQLLDVSVKVLSE